ncbi:hypothetical protein ACETKC_06515 [Brevundimonas intermedia]|uniref:hypothetical protein n=1 Tax=Brevundimonas intermedia TaxID=74315 RepID=UPI0022F27939|nr:hypothetical protein [Brevundimonas intermedia]
MAALNKTIATLSFSPKTRVKALPLAGRADLRFDELSKTNRYDLMHGVARMELEQARLMVFRLSDRLSPYRPLDTLFAETADRQMIPICAMRFP